MKKIISILLSMCIVLSFTACKKESKKSQNYNRTHFTITLTNGAVMSGELFPKEAPETVANFIKLCDEHFYDGLLFHRVIENYIVQGGGYDKNMEPKETDTIKGEFSKNGVANKLSHTRGTISMARTSEYDSGANQFFIVQRDAPELDGEYAAFGKITEGLKYIDEIAEGKTDTYKPYGMKNVPVKQVVIESITVE